MKRRGTYGSVLARLALAGLAGLPLAVWAQSEPWSANVNISQASQPATTRTSLIDASNTFHVIFSAIPGVGTEQLFHTYRRPGQSWSGPAQVSFTEQGAAFRFLQADQTGHLHLFFDAIPGTGVQQVWHSELNIANLAAGWSANVNVSQASQPATAQSVSVDGSNTVHLVFDYIPPSGTLQIFHTYKQRDQTWSTPVQVSQTGQGADHRFLQADRTGNLHLFFESIPGLGVQQVWHSQTATSNLLAGWSTNVNVSQASQPATAERLLIDRSNTVHLLFGAIPGEGTPNLFHAYKRPGQTWSTPTQIPNSGERGTPPFYTELLADRERHLHLLYLRLPGPDERPIAHSELDIGNLGAGWSAPVTIVSYAFDQPRAMVGFNNALNFVFGTIPVDTVQLYHMLKKIGQPWSSATQLSFTGQGANLSAFREDRVGTLHVLFESIPGLGVQQVWHTASIVCLPEMLLLDVGLQGNNAVISWPADCAGAVLEETTTLSTNWTPFGAPVMIVGNRAIVTVSISGDQRFYRLRLP